MTSPGRWRVSTDLQSANVGAPAAYAQVVDWDDVPPLLVPGLVEILSSWMWQDGRETRWWLGIVVEARSAVDAAQRVMTVVADRTSRVQTRVVAVQATAAASVDDDLETDEELDAQAIPGSTAPYIVPVRASAYSRSGARLTLEWVSGAAPLAHVTLEVTESLTVGLFERRPPLTGPNAPTGELLKRVDRHVVIDVGDAPDGLPVLDRYSGEYLPEGNDHPEDPAIQPVFYNS